MRARNRGLREEALENGQQRNAGIGGWIYHVIVISGMKYMELTLETGIGEGRERSVVETAHIFKRYISVGVP